MGDSMKKLIFLLTAIFSTTPLLANSITNQELLKACKDSGPGPQNFCYGFIIATANAAQFYRNIADVQDEYVDICFPENLSNKELVNLYIVWGAKNLALATSPAFLGVSSALSIKYSCPEKKESEKKSTT